MRVWKYNNYDEYIEVQINGNLEKFKSHSYVSRSIIELIVNYLHEHKLVPNFGLCHGTRRGREQKYFMELFQELGQEVKVLGTEISHTANLFENTIEWDFNKVKPEWIGTTDFIYSNSFDHSFDPQITIDSWMSCLTEKGFCFIEWAADNLKNRPMDPVAGTLDEWVEFFQKSYKVVDTLEGSKDPGSDGASHRIVIVLQN